MGEGTVLSPLFLEGILVATLTDYKKFVEAWYTSKTLDDVMEKTGLSDRQCSNRAVYIRRLGVHLPKMGYPQDRRNYNDAHITSDEKAELIRFAAVCAAEASATKYRNGSVVL